MVHGISHITLLVKDLEKSAHLFRVLLDAEEVYSSDGKNFSHSSEKFFVIGGVWVALMQGEEPPYRSYGHVAFKIDAVDLPMYRKRIEDLALDVLPSRERYDEEGESLYFYDYDNHLFELHSGTLDKRLAFYKTKK